MFMNMCVPFPCSLPPMSDEGMSTIRYLAGARRRCQKLWSKTDKPNRVEDGVNTDHPSLLNVPPLRNRSLGTPAHPSFAFHPRQPGHVHLYGSSIAFWRNTQKTKTAYPSAHPVIKCAIPGLWSPQNIPP